MSYSLRMLSEQYEELRKLLLRDENESAAIVLCGRSRVRDPWSGDIDERFLVREIISVPDSAYVYRDPFGFEWSTTPFYNAIKRAESKQLAVAMFHSHPKGPLQFSTRDDISDDALFGLAFNRLESRKPHLSVIMTGGGDLLGRVYGPDLKPTEFTRFVTIGERWQMSDATIPVDASPELDRQARAFGSATSMQLSNLKVGIVGLGGTGSAVAMLLPRIGIRRLALLDKDFVDETNLGRLHSAGRYDANLRRLKVDVVGEAIARVGLQTSIVRVPTFDDDPLALATLRSCDLIFGCTDDHLGREILNRIAYLYYIPVIDLGLLIEPNAAGGYDTFDGRVTVVQPGYVCQTCRGLISTEQIYLEALRRDEDLLEARRIAGYVPNNPEPNPVVVTFTTEVASMAVNELFHRINGFRGPDQRSSERVRQFQFLKDSDTLPKGKSNPDCKLCGSRHYDGRGDMQPLLDLAL